MAKIQIALAKFFGWRGEKFLFLYMSETVEVLKLILNSTKPWDGF